MVQNSISHDIIQYKQSLSDEKTMKIEKMTINSRYWV